MLKILVADDEPIERAVVKKIIDSGLSGECEVFFAENGREAYETYIGKECDIALLDIMMPGMNGLEAAELIRRDDERAVIIFLTAFDEFEYAKKAISVRALEYLLKPVDEKELILTLEEAKRLLDTSISNRKPKPGLNVDNEETLDGKQAAIKVRMKEYLETHYVEDISLSDLAGDLNYSDAYCSKVFKICFNKGFIIYLTELRIKRSKELLEDISVNIKDISTKVGFRDSNYYTKVFKRMEGMTPSEYRNMRGCDGTRI